MSEAEKELGKLYVSEHSPKEVETFIYVTEKEKRAVIKDYLDIVVIPKLQQKITNYEAKIPQLETQVIELQNYSNTLSISP